MHIAFDATAATRQYAGVGRFARGLLAGLGRVDAHNKYSLLTLGSPRIQPTSLEVPRRATWRPVRIPERAAAVLWYRWRLPLSPAAFVRDANLFFTPDFTLMPVHGIPSVVTVHDLSFISHPEYADERLRRFLLSVVPRSIERAAMVVAVSQATADELATRLGVRPERIHLIPNGIDRYFGPIDDDQHARDACSAELQSRFGLQPGYLLAVGTLEPRKNYQRLLRAFALLRRPVRAGGSGAARPGLASCLVIAGREGWQFEPIFREAARLGLGDQVRFITRFDDRDLRLLYRCAALFICSSVSEGFGLPPLEALACGTPVVSSSGGALPEILDDAATYFNPLDEDAMARAIFDALNDPERCTRLVARGQVRVSRYSWEHAATSALSLFQHLVGSSL